MNFTRINEKCISTLPGVGLFLDVAISKRIKTDEANFLSFHVLFEGAFLAESEFCILKCK